MGPFQLNINDRCHVILWYIADKARQTHRVFIEPVTDIKQLYCHRKQVEDLIDELKITLRNFPKWSCGRELVTQMINLVLRLKEYQYKVFNQRQKHPHIVII